MFEFVLELDVICFFKGANFIILAFKVGSHEDLLEVIDFVFSHDEDVVFVLNLPNKVYGLIIDGEVETNKTMQVIAQLMTIKLSQNE